GLDWRAVALVGVAWAINPMSIAFAVGGMETSLFVLVVLAALALAVRGNLTWAALAAGSSAFVRPEGALVGATVLGWTFLVRRRSVPHVLSAFVAPVLAGALALVTHYGSPLPNSIAAKQVAYLAPAPYENSVALLLQAGLPGGSTYLLAPLPAA